MVQNVSIKHFASALERSRHMTDISDDMNDDDNFEQLVLVNQREWNSFWFWRDKPVGERGIARDILEAVGI